MDYAERCFLLPVFFAVTFLAPCCASVWFVWARKCSSDASYSVHGCRVLSNLGDLEDERLLVGFLRRGLGHVCIHIFWRKMILTH